MRFAALGFVCLFIPPLYAQTSNATGMRTLESAFTTVAAGLSTRNVGPANMGGRIPDLVGVESDPKTWYVATANGGVWKTTDSGATMTPLFDAQDTLCIGAVAICQGKPDVVYVGTGEANPRNSVSWGKGVYKSTDGGKTWAHLGLAETQHIGRIAVHPTNPDVAYVAALGHVWAANDERGMYKTEDGGKTWKKSLFLDADTGFVDVQMDPSDPETLYAAAYPCRRDQWSGGSPRMQYGPKGGLYKTTDGGKTWAKMGGGLPRVPYGRSGLSIYRKNPNVVFAIVQTSLTDDLTGNSGQRAADNDADVKKGGIFRSDDKGVTWNKINDVVPRPFYYGQIRVDPNDEKRLYVLGVSCTMSVDGGATFRPIAQNTHADHHAMWINPKDSNQVVLGNDGGLYLSTNKAQSFTAIRGMAIGQFYGVAVDMGTPYKIYGGLQDNGSWGGPSATDRASGILIADWFRVGGGDGFQAAVDPTDPNTVYVESQYGALTRVNPSARGGRGGGGGGGGGGRGGAAAVPAPARAAAIGAVAGGVAANASASLQQGRGGGGGGGSIRPPGRGAAGGGGRGGGSRGGANAERFNWNSPIFLSPHDPKTIFYGSQHLWKSTNRGDTWERLGTDLTRGQAGGRTNGNTLTAICQSPLDKDVLYVGADDGRIQMSRDGGKTWTDLSKNFGDLPQDRWVTKIECSHFDAGTAFLSVDRHRNDDHKPYLFKTTDYGQTWTSIAANLPGASPVHVVRQSSKNKNLLFAGTEHGLYASIDGGGKWHHLTAGLPKAVTVHDLVIHPRDRDLVIGTHARSVFVMDAGPLEELTDEVAASPAHLFAIKAATPVTPRGGTADPKEFAGPNPPAGAVIHYLAAGPATLTVTDRDGKTVATWSKPAAGGLDRVVWDLTSGGEKMEFVPAGDYTATLTVGPTKKTQKIVVAAAKPK